MIKMMIDQNSDIVLISQADVQMTHHIINIIISIHINTITKLLYMYSPYPYLYILY